MVLIVINPPQGNRCFTEFTAKISTIILDSLDHVADYILSKESSSAIAIMYCCDFSTRSLSINDSDIVALRLIREMIPPLFLIAFDLNLSEAPLKRQFLTDIGCNMVAYDISCVVSTLETKVFFLNYSNRDRDVCKYYCPYCHLDNLSAEMMWHHCPAYHINTPNNVTLGTKCFICSTELNQPFQVHLHHYHRPPQVREENHATRTNFYSFGLVICRNPTTGKYLLCQEFGNEGYWCPGGRIDNGETPSIAARRETIEEAGVDVNIMGILKIEYSTSTDSRGTPYVRMRIIFYAEPRDVNQLPKCIPDYESVGACWCSPAELMNPELRCRGPEPRIWVNYLENGGQVHPLSLLEERTRR